MIQSPISANDKHHDLVAYICKRCQIAVNGGLHKRNARPDEPIAMSPRELAAIICEALRLDRL